MNIRSLARPIIAALTLTAAVPTLAADADALVFNCADLRLPDQQTVSRVFGIGNFNQAYAARGRAIQIAQRECLRRAGKGRMAAKDALHAETPTYAKSAE